MSQPIRTIAVVVVTYNSAHLLADLFGSLPGGLAGLGWRLVIADNASADDTVAVARRLAPEATVVETGRNGGYAAGINAGVSAALAADPGSMRCWCSTRTYVSSPAAGWRSRGSSRCRPVVSPVSVSRCPGWSTPRAG